MASEIEIPLLGLIGTVGIIIGILLPPSIIKTTLYKETVFTYEYEKLQQTLLTLLSSTHEGKPIYEIISANANNPENLEFLKNYLDKLIESKCYSIQIGNENDFTPLIENSNCDKKYSFVTAITMPYNPEENERIKLLRIDVG